MVNQMAEEQKTTFDYLGDGVYARYDGYSITLLANSHEEPTDVIDLEPNVLDALIRFRDRVTSDS
jgi:hypothetical protein